MQEEDKLGSVVTPDTGGWQFTNEDHRAGADSNSRQSEAQNSIETVQWTASEFIAHHKTVSWYAVFMAGAAILTGVVYLLTRDKMSSGMIVVAATLFGIFGARKPRVLNYAVDQQGLRIDKKFYPYELFKSFAVVQEGAIDSIMLMPLKRFMPVITVYFAPEDGTRIVNVLGEFLPHENRQADMIDSLMHKLRF